MPVDSVEEEFPCPVSVETPDYIYISVIYCIANNDVGVELECFTKLIYIGQLI